VFCLFAKQRLNAVLTPTGVENAYMDIDVLGESAIGVFCTGDSPILQ